MKKLSNMINFFIGKNKINNIYFYFKNNKINKKINCYIFSFFFSLFSILSVIDFHKNVVYASELYDGEVEGELTVCLNLAPDVIEPYFEQFEKKYPNCTIQYICCNDYESDLLQMMKEDDYCDVCYVPSFVQYNQILDLYMPLGTYEELSEKYNFVNQGYSVNGVIYSIPSSAYLMGIAYNKDLFYKAGVSERPKSIEDFLQALAMIQETTNAIPMASGYATDWDFFNWTCFPYLEMSGSLSYKSNFVHELDPFTSGGNFYEAYKLLYDACALGYTEPDPNSLDWYSIITKINSGEIGCVTVGSWAMHQIMENGLHPESVSFMPFPFEVDGKQYATIMTDYSYAIPLTSKNPTAAKAFIDFMLDESGYAIGEDRVSIVKTDPLPKSYGDMTGVEISTNGSYVNDDWSYYETLRSGIDPTANENIKEIVAAAYGLNDKTYDDIMNEWNMAWEAARPSGMETYTRGDEGEYADSSESNDDAVSLSVLDYDIQLSTTENEYVHSVDSLKVGYVKNMAPFSYEIEDEFRGIARELMDDLVEQTDIKVEFVGYRSTNDAILGLENGEIDMISSMPVYPNSSDTVKTSISYIETMPVILRNDSIPIENIQTRKQAVIEGESSEFGLYQSSNVIAAADYVDLIDKIENLHADYAVVNYYSAIYYSRLLETDHVEIVPLGKKVDVAFGFSKSVDLRLVSICNKLLYGIPADRVQLSLMEHMNPPIQKVSWQRIIEDYPLQIIICISGVFLVIIFIILMYTNERGKAKKKRLIDARKYEIISKMMDEYIFEYYEKEGVLQFDNKFVQQYDYGKEIQRATYDGKDEWLNQMFDLFDQAVYAETTTTEPFELKDKAGKISWFRMILYRVSDEKASNKQFFGKIVNVDHEVLETIKIRSEAEKDALTGIFNRFGFEKNYRKLRENARADSSMCLCIADLDCFKQVNDSIGHAGGDEALRMFAEKISDFSSNQILVSRYGGDEFLIASFGVPKEDMESLISTLVKEMDTELLYDDVYQKLSISVGACFANSKQDYRDLFTKADEALYQVKNGGRNNYKLIEYC